MKDAAPLTRPRNLSPGLLFLALLLITVVPAFAQGYGRVVSQPAPDLEKAVRPYLFGNFGYGRPADAAYDLAFDSPFFRFGGGFGMTFRDFGAEVMLRRGSLEETHLVAAEYDKQAQRTFYLSTTEIQFRLYGRPRMGRVIFPAGIGLGLVTITVDRGYPGVFDRFSGSGLYVNPFVGVDYPIGDMLSLGGEVEYSIGRSSFSGSSAWKAQHDNLIHQQGGFFPATADGFWDTVGGSSEDFSDGGWIISARITLFIPTYNGE